MRANQLRSFDGAGVVAGVILQGTEDYLEIGENGILAGVPNDVTGFHLMLAAKKNGRTFVAQKNVGQEGGGYHRDALSDLEGFAKGFIAVVMRDPIEVVRAGKNVWTSWHQQKPNRVDCWQLGKDGALGLFQVGVFTHDDGRSWKLHGEYRWRGRLYKDGDKLVGLPESPRWGSLEGGSSARTQIFQHPDFVALIKTAKLKVWNGKPEELNPPLPAVPEPGQAVMQWYITFAGQTGQGPANLHPSDGKSGWIHGVDIQGVQPDPDGESRLWQGDVIAYSGMVKGWGSKKDGPPKLLGVRLVKRTW